MNQNNTTTGLISCIIPVYNREKLIVECVQSVLNQNYPAIEIIIVDDGSTDNTNNVLLTLQQQHPGVIHIFKQTNQGPGAARQLGLDHAKGEFIQFLDSDDLILPSKFFDFKKEFDRDSTIDIVFCITHYYTIGSSKNHIIWKKAEHLVRSILPNFISNRAWSTSTPIYRKALLNLAGKILPLSCEEDLEYDCRIGLQHPKLAFIDKHLTDFRHHQGERFSVNNQHRAKQLSHQIEARSHIYNSIRKFGLKDDSEHMKRFSKNMFLLARQASSMQLLKQSQQAFNLAKLTAEHLSIKDKTSMKIFAIACFTLGLKHGAHIFSSLYDRLNLLRRN